MAARESESGPIGPVGNESQQRELSRLPSKDRPDAWSEAVAAAGGRVTAKMVRMVVDQRLNTTGDGEKIIDGQGNAVTTAQLRPVFQARVHFMAVRVEINALRTRLRAMAAAPGGRVLGRNLQRLDTDLRNISEALKFSAPYSICPRCEAHKPRCDLCGGPGGEDPCGWITSSQFDAMEKT